jgi:DNA end-binding protein Ku
LGFLIIPFLSGHSKGKGVDKMRAMWKGAISFGLVTIPIRMYVATDNNEFHFRQLHEECKTPIQYKKWCPHCDRQIEQREILRGFEYAPGSFVIITDEDLEKLPLPTARSVEIINFVEPNEIDPIYTLKSYYLGPDEIGMKPYKLLYETMKNTGKVGVGKVAFRTKEHLVALRTYQNCILMDTVHYPNEIRNAGEVPGTQLDNVKIGEKELTMAEALVEQLTEEFQPTKYVNEYQEAIREVIEAKFQGEEVEVAEPKAANVIDLMEALQASLESTKKNAAKKIATS